MIRGLNISIPQRLFFIRISVTLALILSFFLSFHLWFGSSLFPNAPLFKTFHIAAPFETVLTSFSILFLICSLLLRKSRLFILLSLLVNVCLVIFDLNRLQPWFYVYNAILFVMLFYNGRVDDSAKYTSIFILIQLILTSVYVYNGLNQFRAGFIENDFRDTILPLSNLTSERQFAFFLNMGRFVPCFIIFMGLGLLIRPVRYLAIFSAWSFHFLLLIFLFPSDKNPNYALWLMNLAFAMLLLFLFSGQTRQKHFSAVVLLQKPLFYVILFAFWLVPALNYLRYWPKAPTTNFMCGKSVKINIDALSYEKLPVYLKHFCSKNEQGYELRAGDWCRYELGSEYTGHASFNNIFKREIHQITSHDVKETEDELSSL
jgi:hypothetical protein